MGGAGTPIVVLFVTLAIAAAHLFASDERRSEALESGARRQPVVAEASISTPVTAEELETTEIKKLIAPDAEWSDFFGTSVAISGDTVVVGAIFDDDLGTIRAGSASVFVRDHESVDAWGRQKKLVGNDTTSGDYFGCSVAADGDTVVVGARFHSLTGLPEAGAAYVFQRNHGGENAWGQVAKLTAVNPDANASFGSAVAISGDTVVVGAVWDDHDGLNHAGSAYIFMRDQGGDDNWGQEAKLTAWDAETRDEFGTSLAVEGETVVVGALLDDHPGMLEAGSAYIFNRDHGGENPWAPVAKITASDGEAGDEFGTSVAINGGFIVVGVAGYAGERAYIFRREADAWDQVARLTASDGASNDDFGYAVDIEGDIVVVGARYGGESGKANAGAAYFFLRNHGGDDAWGEAAKVISSDAESEDRFGISVAIDDTTVVIGANCDDHSGLSNAGSAYLFQLSHSSAYVFEDDFESGCTGEWSSTTP
jgi:hypothetical protein